MTQDEQQTTNVRDRSAPALRVAGGGLLAATAGIHLDLYLTGYRHIPTIGTLFLLQVVTGLVLACGVVAVARPIVALAGAGFAASTLGGYILSLWIGLFGFNEVRTTSGIVAGVIEIAAFTVLAIAGTRPQRGRPASQRSQRLVAARRLPAPLGVLALVVLVVAVANSPGTAAPAGSNSGSAPTASTASSSAVVKVTIENFAFSPSAVHAAPGERIVVTNKDSVTHTFTAMPGASPLGHFSSGDIAPGKTVTVTAPTTSGSYSFYCAIHPFMTGTLTVS